MSEDQISAAEVKCTQLNIDFFKGFSKARAPPVNFGACDYCKRDSNADLLSLFVLKGTQMFEPSIL